MGMQEWLAARGENRRLRNAAKLELRNDLVRRYRSLRQKVSVEDGILRNWSEERRNWFWNLAPDQRAALLSYEAVLGQEVRRRTVLIGAGAAGAVLAVGAGVVINIDQITGQRKEERESDIQTHLEVLDICRNWFHPEKGDKAKELFFATAGIGIGNSYDAAKAMGVEGLGLNPDEKATPMTYLVTSVEGKKIPEVAECIQKAAEMGEALSLYGQSNGSVVILEALNYLKQKGIVIPVKRLIINCSPFDFNDAQQNYLSKLFGKLLVYSGYKPGDISQFFYQLKEEANIDWRHIYNDLLGKIEDAWHDAANGGPLASWVADLRILINSDLKHADLSDIITKDTEVLLLKSDRDGVVDDKAIGKYQEKLGPGPKGYGAKVSVAILPNDAGHADITAAGQAAHPWLNRTNFALAE